MFVNSVILGSVSKNDKNSHINSEVNLSHKLSVKGTYRSNSKSCKAKKQKLASEKISLIAQKFVELFTSVNFSQGDNFFCLICVMTMT